MGQQHALHVVTVIGDQLAQETKRQQIFALGFFLDDDLGEDRAGNVIPLKVT